jgi:hypothetical protein
MIIQKAHDKIKGKAEGGSAVAALWRDRRLKAEGRVERLGLLFVFITLHHQIGLSRFD